MKKIKKEIKGYGAIYYVSNNGKVTNQKGLELILKPDNKGFMRVNLLSKNKTHRNFVRVDVLVAMAFLNFDEQLHTLTYKDGNYQNLRADNLQVTPILKVSGKEKPIPNKDLIVECFERGLSSAASKFNIDRKTVKKLIQLAGCNLYSENIVKEFPYLLTSTDGEKWVILEESPRYIISNKGRFRDLTRKYNSEALSRLNLTPFIDINGKTFSSISLLDKYFSLAGEGNFITFKDSDMTNLSVDNLVKTKEPFEIKSKLRRPPAKDELVKCIKECGSINKAALKKGVSSTTIKRWLKNYNLPQSYKELVNLR